MHTPFFPSLRPRLAACGARTPAAPPPRPRDLLQLEALFGGFIPPGLLAPADEGPHSRERVYSLRRTFWGFLYQVLNPGGTCRQVVLHLLAWAGLNRPEQELDERTSGYCQARRRLPLERLQRIRVAVAARADRALPQAEQRWRGFFPKVIDGTTCSLPDTPKNQRAYPQSRSQHPGCGFPLLKLVALFSLTSGVLLDYAKGNKNQSELSLLQRLLERFGPHDLAVADRGFSSYTLIALLLRRSVHSLFRLHQARPQDLRQGRRLGKNDRLVTWSKPPDKPRYLPNTLWKLIPSELSVRVLRFALPARGFRTQAVSLVTTLLDPQQYPAEELARLCARRWRIELWFRDLKTTMGVERLRCHSPALVHKELEMFFLAYNLIRALMTEAAAIHHTPLERLSFKGTVEASRQFSLALVQARRQKQRRHLFRELLRIIASDEVPDRPGRREPRAVKRRPKPYPLLNRPRHRYKEIPHRGRYRRPTKSKALI